MFLLALFWFVQFTDKLGSAPIPFSERATENRLLWSIPTDSLDYAVVPDYIQGVRATGARVCHVSRWMNGVTVEADSAQMQTIAALPYVQAVELTRDNTPAAASVAPRKMNLTLDASDPYGSNRTQLAQFNLLPLHQLGYEGKGIRMAIIDAGFYKVNTATCFSSAREQLVGVYDYSEDDTSIYGSAGVHGAYCLSTIAGQTDTYHGAATQAEYVLIRTEEITPESPKEMDNLVAAIELCDSLGVNIISCSLGYRLFDNPSFNLTYDMLDGRTTRVSRAAAIAARKGILCCFSAGNDGNKTWHRISVPCDADSILTIGAVNKDTVMANFSSFGPSADGRVKPEVCAMGVSTVLLNPANSTSMTGNGTSFSTPLVAGLAACLWSAMPNATAQDIRQRIIQSAHLYPSYDTNYQMGYGIPDAEKAYQVTPTLIRSIHEDGDKPYKILKDGHLFIVLKGSHNLGLYLVR
ncbi:MAG: S8 family serine peptidase [Paludibacteraceae bacterium]|nr:S8 family serine peptidase [Paludibacteraceae bacterium]